MKMKSDLKYHITKSLNTGLRCGLALAVLGSGLLAAPALSQAKTLHFTQNIHVAPGVEFQTLHLENGGVRNAINQFTIDTSNGATVGLGVTDPLHRLTTTATQAQRVHDSGTWVAGAINGAFNEVDGSGMPATMIIRDNRLVHLGRLSSGQDGYNFFRYAFGVDQTGAPVIDNYILDVDAHHNGRRFHIGGMNNSRLADQMTLFTPVHRMETVGANPSSYATEIVVRELSQPVGSLPVGEEITGTVTEVYRIGEPSNARIPEDGLVLSANGQQWAEALTDVREGDIISIRVDVNERWQNARYLIQSGPQLVKDGTVQISMDEQSLQARTRHPRSAVAVSKDRTKAFLVTVDGRQSGYSQGMTLREFSEYLVSIGAYQAINLDGGGSTTSVLRVPGNEAHLIANRPSDGSLRGVSTSLLALTSGPGDFVTGASRVIDPMEDRAFWNVSSARGEVALSVNRTPEPVRVGEKSVRLQYDFTKSESGVSAAYLNLNHPRILMGKPVEIGMWVFSNGQPNWLRGNLLDRNRVQVTIDFTEDGGMSWGGWRYVRARIPAGVSYPVSLQRVYVAQTRDDRKTAGTVHIDQIEAIYDPAYQVQRFTDVTSEHWALANIEYLSDRNIISGYFDGSFKPDRAISREHAAVMLVRELGLSTEGRRDPGFTDVLDNRSTYGAISTVAATGLMVGKEPGKFMPEAPLTRAEMAVILDRAYTLAGNADEHEGFRDVAANHWAGHSIRALAASRITGGYPDGTFKPSGQLSRAEFATFMARIMIQNNR